MLYTFRTFPREQLARIESPIFVFSKLHEDFERISAMILKENPHCILGFAKASRTRFEKFAVNRFNGVKKIHATGPEQYLLCIPNGAPCSVKATESFCNWTAFRLAKFIDEHHLNI